MPIPMAVARFNRVGTNRVTRTFAGWAPMFGILEHVGRRSGQMYRTPINLFTTPDGFAIALTYGRDVDWLKNLLAAGGATIQHRGKRMTVSDPRLTGPDEAIRWIPAPIRLVLRLLKVNEFVLVRAGRR
jgi:deazaflavin-dependent oxidoreductase (nitroreductase family)